MYATLSNPKREKILRGYVPTQTTLSPSEIQSQSNLKKQVARNPYPNLPLETGLNVSYSPLEKAQKTLQPYGYVLDTGLSSRETKVFHNPYENKMIFSVAGTNPLSPRDIGTDAYLAFMGNAGLRQTNRYKEAKSVLEKAREKYKGSKKVLVGHSLASTIISDIAKPEEKVYGFGTGSGLFPSQQKGNFYRTAYDPFSYTSYDKVIPTYKPEKKGNLRSSQKVDYPGGIFPSHSYQNLRSNPVFV
jgi:hypothetical protein